MRAMFGLIGLVIVLALVGLLVKKQMATTKAPVPALQGASAPTGSVREQSQQMQEQVKQQMDSLMQQARPMPEDAEK